MGEQISPVLPRGPRCPICHRPSDATLRPFRSKRCADVDLHRWLGGHYAVPDDQLSDDGDAPPDDANENPGHR